ncbi:MAG: acylphosphatase [Gammaproteobacteria bacterium]
MVARKFIIRGGRVQGVGFRQATRKTAARLRLAGWVRNLPNGDVEVAARGAPEVLAELEAWLQHGPDAAKVRELREVKDGQMPPEDDHMFRIL